jgi:hypothetical protein
MIHHPKKTRSPCLGYRRGQRMDLRVVREEAIEATPPA